MTREELQQLSKSELIEIILGQQALIEQLQARVAQLEEQIKRLTGPPKGCSNSSVPSSKSPKLNHRQTKRKKKRGPKPGHQGASRKRQPPDLIVECRPTRCKRCGADLTQACARLLGTSQLVELPPIKPVVIEARRYQVTCPACAAQQAAQYPPGLEPQRTFGAGIQALVCYLHHVQHISYHRLEKLMRQVFGLDLSQGAIANLMRRAAGTLQPQAQKTRESIRASRTIEQVLGEAQPQVWISDCFSAQLKAPAKERQLCLAHQLRDLQYGIEAERCGFCYRMQQLLRRALRLGKRRESLSPQIFAGLGEAD